MASYADKPWLKSYKLGPYKLAQTKEPYPKMPLYKILDDTATEYGHRAAISYLGREISYGELKLYADKLATALAELGVKKGDRVATIIPPCPQYIISDFAILKIGAAHVPCSTLHKADELIYEVGDSGAETVICSDISLDLVNSIKNKKSGHNRASLDPKIETDCSMPRFLYIYKKFLFKNFYIIRKTQ